MNKDTIYIEPADDITDIIAKIKDSEQKVVALVPPKKLGVLGSAINIKLIAKVANSTSKAVVLVTDNPSLMKLCAAAELPVAETLQSRPSIPSGHDIAAAEHTHGQLTIAEEAEQAEAAEEREELAKEFTAEPESAAEVFDTNSKLDTEEIEDDLAADAAKDIDAEGVISIDENDDSSDSDRETDKKPKKSAENPEKTAKKSAKAPKKSKKVKKYAIIGSIIAVLFVAALVWAFAIAPAADIIVSVGTTSANFSENVTFTTKQNEEDAKSGKFYLETLEYKETLSSPLEATGEKNIGEKASGKLEISYTFKSSASTSITVPAGSSFTQGGLKYTNAEKATLTAPSSCTLADLSSGKCIASTSLTVTAAEPGEKYNCDKGMSWTTNVSGLGVANSTAISGGSNKIVKILQQKDIDTALASLNKLTESEAKSILAEKLSAGYVLIDSSYKAESGDPKTSSKTGEELSEGAKVEQEITYQIFAVDSERIAEFIKQKVNLAADQKIYELGNPYVERFTTDGDTITGKLKTAYKAGPEITYENILEKVKGRKTGEAYSLLQSINGVKNVDIKTSYFWVNSIPSDANKVHINIEVKE